jgi:hypothetical protein
MQTILRVHAITKITEGVVVVSKEFGLIKLSTWSDLEIRMQYEVTVSRLIIVPWKGLKNSHIWERP